MAESSRAQAQRLAEDVRTITSVVRRAVSTDPRTREAAWTEFEARAGYANAKLSASLSGKFDPVTYVGAKLTGPTAAQAMVNVYKWLRLFARPGG